MQDKIAAVIQELFATSVSVELTRPEEQFGDYATNVALQLAKPLGRPPRQIAEEIASALRENLDGVQDVTVAGPGFINFRLSDATLAASLDALPAQSYEGQKVLLEYSDPNPLKPLHAGHLYTTLVGDTMSRLVANAGAEVIRINFGGDVGRHVAISMWSIIRTLGGEDPAALDAIIEADRPTWLGTRYVEGTAAFEDDPAAQQEIVALNARVYALHAADDHDSRFAQIYWTVRQWSYDYFAVLYQQLQIKPFDRFLPESEVTELGLATVKDQLSKGVYKVSDGAVVYDGEAEGLHTRVFITSAGLPTYEAKDVGLILTKWRDYHYDKSIIITASEQTSHFEVMLASVRHFEPDAVERTRHIAHGLVKLQGGIKMSSRKGNTVTALEILDAARQAATDSGVGASEDTVLAAVKYAFAKSRIGGDIAYDPAESIALEGNSGPYLQYAHARARSILAKANDAAMPAVFEPAERSLLRKLSEYNDAVARATDELMPHHICSYLYELAQAFNRFYENNRVIADPRQAGRLWLVGRYADTLKAGLDLLGIVAPERM